MHNKFKSPDIITALQVRRSEWLWRVETIDGARIANKLQEGTPGTGREKKGRPRLTF